MAAPDIWRIGARLPARQNGSMKERDCVIENIDEVRQ